MTVSVKPDGTRCLRIPVKDAGTSKSSTNVDVTIDDSEDGLFALGPEVILEMLRENYVGMEFWRETAMEFKRAGKVEECEEVFNAAYKEIDSGARITDPHTISLLVGFAGYMYEKYVSTNDKHCRVEAEQLLASA